MLDPQSGIIFDIRRFSIHDGPGIRTTVFFKGCPLACQWCHNPESQSAQPELWLRAGRCIGCGACLAACPAGAITLNEGISSYDPQACRLCGVCVEACQAEARELVGRRMTVAQVLAVVERDLPFYDESGGGVTFSGGEPLMQPHFLGQLLHACREKEIHTTLDTSGFASWETLDRLRGEVDLFLYDLKLISDARHQATVGVSNRLILENLRRLATAGHAIWLRVPVIPCVNDDPENMAELAQFVATLPGQPFLHLLPYHASAEKKYELLARPYLLNGLAGLPAERMQALAADLRSHGVNATAIV